MKNFEIEIEKAFAEVKERTTGLNFLIASHIRKECREYLQAGELLKRADIREVGGKEFVDAAMERLEIGTSVLCEVIIRIDKVMGEELKEEVKEAIEEIKAAIN